MRGPSRRSFKIGAAMSATQTGIVYAQKAARPVVVPSWA
jgi:hypothetical protein